MLYGELYKLVDLVEEEFLDWKKYPLPPQPAFGQFWQFVTNDIWGRKQHPEAPVPYETQERFRPLLDWYRKSVEYRDKK